MNKKLLRSYIVLIFIENRNKNKNDAMDGRHFTRRTEIILLPDLKKNWLTDVVTPSRLLKKLFTVFSVQLCVFSISTSFDLSWLFFVVWWQIGLGQFFSVKLSLNAIINIWLCTWACVLGRICTINKSFECFSFFTFDQIMIKNYLKSSRNIQDYALIKAILICNFLLLKLNVSELNT